MIVLYCYPAAMGCSDTGGNAKPQSEVVLVISGGVCPVEALENFLLLTVRNAAAGIGDGKRKGTGCNAKA